MGRIFKRKNDFSKSIVILDIIIFILYIIINIIMMWKKSYAMPVDINAGVFAFLTGELGLLSFIKRSKIKAETIQPITESIQNKIDLEQLQQLLQNTNSHGAAG